MTITYGIMALIAIVLLIGYSVLIKTKELWLTLVYICVAIVNVGYFMLSSAKTLEFALFSNKFAYLGSVFLSMCMFMIIVKLCGFQYKKSMPIVLTVIATIMFGVICTTGILPWYYKEVSLVFVNGAATLDKIYGILHPTYMIYLGSYFAAMILCIFRSIKEKRIASQRHAALMASIVFGNIAIWFIEKFVPTNFEFLSISYIMSEIIFLALYWMMEDYIRLDQITESVDTVNQNMPVDLATMPVEQKILRVLSHLDGEMLTTREREILELILLNKKRKEIAEELHLSENTIKTYTRTLYTKLNVSSREELNALLIQ